MLSNISRSALQPSYIKCFSYVIKQLQLATVNTTPNRKGKPTSIGTAAPLRERPKLKIELDSLTEEGEEGKGHFPISSPPAILGAQRSATSRADGPFQVICPIEIITWKEMAATEKSFTWPGIAEESIPESSPLQTPGSPVRSLTTLPWKLGQFLLTPSAWIQKGRIKKGKDYFAASPEHL